MRTFTQRLGLCWLALALSPHAHALDFEFHAPADAGDPGVAAVMRDLAERILPVYHDDNPERYLSSLSALQLVAGHYDAAQGTREALRQRRQESRDTKARTDARAAPLDLYASARSIEARDRAPLAQAFERVFSETVPQLGDHDAYESTAWRGMRTDSSQQALQQAFDRVRDRDQVEQGDALRLVWTWLALEIGRSVGSQLETLGADDDRRRYVVEENRPIGTASGVTLHASVVRPKNAATRLPALLEFALAGSANDAKASAAHGYAGVVVTARGKKRARDADDARAVIAWIARQPWSDGRVGMFGHDDSALTAWAAAMRRPRALRAIATEDAVAPRVDFPGKQFRAMTIPVLAMIGDCGGAGVGSLYYFRQHTRHNKNADHTLLLGACNAGAALDESAAAAAPDLPELRYEWFDHVFKGAPVPAVLQGRVNYQAAGTDEWRHGELLPK